MSDASVVLPGIEVYANRRRNLFYEKNSCQVMSISIQQTRCIVNSFCLKIHFVNITEVALRLAGRSDLLGRCLLTPSNNVDLGRTGCPGRQRWLGKVRID